MNRFNLGMWLWSSSLKVANVGKAMAIKYAPEGVFDVATNRNLIIHRIIEGPFTQQDLGYEWTGPEDAECFLVVLLEREGATEEVEWYFEGVEEAYAWVRHFKGSIEPIIINGDTYG